MTTVVQLLMGGGFVVAVLAFANLFINPDNLGLTCSLLSVTAVIWTLTTLIDFVYYEASPWWSFTFAVFGICAIALAVRHNKRRGAHERGPLH